jgi:hypothetical protein
MGNFLTSRATISFSRTIVYFLAISRFNLRVHANLVASKAFVPLNNFVLSTRLFHCSLLLKSGLVKGPNCLHTSLSDQLKNVDPIVGQCFYKQDRESYRNVLKLSV